LGQKLLLLYRFKALQTAKADNDAIVYGTIFTLTLAQFVHGVTLVGCPVMFEKRFDKHEAKLPNSLTHNKPTGGTTFEKWKKWKSKYFDNQHLNF